MGLTRHVAGNTVYLKIFNGNIVKEWKNIRPKGVEDLLERENKNGVMVYYQSFKDVEGELEDVSLRESVEYGDSIVVILKESKEKFHLTIPVESKYGRDFLVRMNGIDLSRPVKFHPYSFFPKEKDEKTGEWIKSEYKKTGMNILQEGEKLDWTYHVEGKDGKKKIPAKVEKKKGSKKVWDNTEQLNFLYDELKDFIVHLNEFKGSEQYATTDIVDDDGLPF